MGQQINFSEIILTKKYTLLRNYYFSTAFNIKLKFNPCFVGVL